MAITYPYRVFRYSVEIKGISRAGFSEVSGMDASTDVVEYREGDDLRNTPRKLTGLTKFSNVTFRWGVSDDKEFLDWIYLVQPKNSAPPTGMARHDITVTLLDDAGKPGPSWTLINAWPVRYAAPDLNALGAEVAIQTLEVCHEGIEMTAGASANTPSPL